MNHLALERARSECARWAAWRTVKALHSSTKRLYAEAESLVSLRRTRQTRVSGLAHRGNHNAPQDPLPQHHM